MPINSSMLVLAGDLGGTNLRLCLIEIENGVPNPNTRKNETLRGAEGLAPLEEIVKRFLENEARPDVACLAVAGPVLNNKCKLTNRPWVLLDGEVLQQELNLPRVELINDFVAVGYNLLLEEERELVSLQEGEKDSKFPIGLIGVGTGLGKAWAVRFGNDYEVYQSEGGHENFAPFNELTDDLLKYLRYFYGAVDVERVVSGPGITNIFHFLRDCQFPREDTGDYLKQEDPSLAISIGAEKGHFLCQRTMEVFAEAYGAAVGDLAVSLLPYGGIYLAGGIAAQNLKLMKGEAFMRGFQNRARVKPELLEKISIYICLNPLEGLEGAIKYARRLMGD